MADVPAEVGSGQVRQENMTAGLSDGFNSLDIFRQIGLMIGLAASIAIGFAVVLWSQEPAYQPLYSNLNRIDSADIISVLSQQQIPYKIEPGSGALLIPAHQIHEARIMLAGAGISHQNPVGFELLDKQDSLGTSQFMESARYKRGLEGELGRTIASMRHIRKARVHLAIPKDTVFVRDSRKPKASVFVDLSPGRSLGREQISAIVNLVSTSIPELETEDVTLVDQNGRLLSDDKNNLDMAFAAKQFEYTRKMESALLERVNGILVPILGSENFRAEISADVDFTKVEQTDEQFNPDMPALRSEATLNESKGGGAQGGGGIPGALANQPQGEATIPEKASNLGQGGAAGGVEGTNVRKQATRNYDLDRTISYTQHQVGRVRRLSVAVVLNHMETTNEAGEKIRQPLTEQERQNLESLVQNAVGYDPARGDRVTVQSSKFATTEEVEIELEPTPIWEQPWFFNVVKQVLGAVLVLALVFGLVKPVLAKIAEPKVKEVIISDESGFVNFDGTGVAGGDGVDALEAAGGSFEQKIDAVKQLAADDPGAVAQVVQGWAGNNG